MFRFRIPLVVVAFLALGAAVALAGEFRETIKVDGDELTVVNLLGHVDVVRGGGEFVVEVRVQGDDADRDKIRIVQDREDGADIVRIEYPLDEEDTFIYPSLGRGKTQITFRDRSERGSFWNRLRGAMGGRKVTIKGKGRGFEAWADIVVKVPEGRTAEVRLGAGDITAKDVCADLTLDTHSGPISARKIRGDLVCDTGSGSVEVRDCEGLVHVDTGSGSVTGEKLKGPKVLVDTGSGRVVLDRVECAKLDVDTGSGGVEAAGVACDAARVDTGSGAVRLELLRLGDGKYLIDTGSGGVDLTLPEDASCRVTCDSGSGGVDVELDDVRIERDGRDEARFVLGDGDARIIVDTGSGRIRIRQAS